MLLLPLYFTLRLTFAIPLLLPSEQPLQPNQTTVPHPNSFGLECAQVNQNAWPKKEDCTSAILQTPDSSEPITFRTGDQVPAAERLPQSYQAGRCQVSFELLNGVDQEKSNWLRLGHAADRLIFACAPAARTKGSILVGKIKVTTVKIAEPRPSRGLIAGVQE